MKLPVPVAAEVQKTGVSVGKNRGHKTTKLVVPAKKQSNHKRAEKELVVGVIREIAGFAPYEKKIMELLKTERDKKAKKLAKKRLGSFKRSKKKVEQMATIISEIRRAEQGHK